MTLFQFIRLVLDRRIIFGGGLCSEMGDDSTAGLGLKHLVLPNGVLIRTNTISTRTFRTVCVCFWRWSFSFLEEDHSSPFLFFFFWFADSRRLSNLWQRHVAFMRWRLINKTPEMISAMLWWNDHQVIIRRLTKLITFEWMILRPVDCLQILRTQLVRCCMW